MNRIWLPPKEEIEVSTYPLTRPIEIAEENELVITNRAKYEDIIAELKDFRNYIAKYGECYQKMTPQEINSQYHVRETDKGIILYERETTHHGEEENFIGEYINPKINILKLLLGTPNESFNLGKLLGTRKIKEVEILIKALESSNISKEEIKYILNTYVGEISMFGLEVLDCIELLPIRRVSKKEVKGYEAIEMQYAPYNSAVLKLARKIQKLK